MCVRFTYLFIQILVVPLDIRRGEHELCTHNANIQYLCTHTKVVHTKTWPKQNVVEGLLTHKEDVQNAYAHKKKERVRIYFYTSIHLFDLVQKQRRQKPRLALQKVNSAP